MATTKKAVKSTGTETAKGKGKTAEVVKTKKGPQAEANHMEVKKAITIEKDLMYIYPKNCIKLETRKKFRHQVRAKNEQFEKAIVKLTEGTDKKALKEKQAEYAEYRKTVMVNP